jgi:hypothetical protein
MVEIRKVITTRQMILSELWVAAPRPVASYFARSINAHGSKLWA